MLTISKFDSAEYYLDAPEPGRSTMREADRVAGDYSERLATEAQARWLVLGISPKIRPLGMPDMFRPIKTGGTVFPDDFRCLVAGRDPRSGLLVARLRRSSIHKPPPAPGGYDLQFSLPKSVSLWAFLGNENKPLLHEHVASIHHRAIVSGFDAAMMLGWIVTRRNGQYEPVARCAIACFPHRTSRDEDMQLHHHCCLLKTAEMADGTVVQIDNYLLKKYAGALAALVRCEEVRIFREEMGLAMEPDRRGYRMIGIPSDLDAVFSKRRSDIVATLAVAGRATDQNRVAAQKAAYDTRNDKTNAPLAHLQLRWSVEAAEAGWSKPALRSSVLRCQKEALAAQGYERHEPADLIRKVMETVNRLTEDQAVFSQPDFYRAVFESLQCGARGLTDALQCVLELEASHLVERVSSGLADPSYTTTSLRKIEQDIVLVAEKMAASSPIFSKADVDDYMPHFCGDAVDQDLDTPRRLNTEQAEAFAGLVTLGGLVLLQAPAGRDKNLVIRSVVLAAKIKELDVLMLAPNSRESHQLCNQIKLDPSDCRVFADVVNDLEVGRFALRTKGLIVVDGAGRVGTRDMHRLLQACEAAGARLILLGDALHYRPVGSGAPFALLGRILPAARIGQTRFKAAESQSGRAWMDAASIDLAAGETVRALEAYDRAGRITWAQDRTAAMDRMIEAYIAHRREFPNHSRAVTVQWTDDAAAVSKLMRQRLRKEGLLGEEDIAVETLPRGKGCADSKMLLSVGDEIVFGESVDLVDVNLRDGDVAVVVAIEGRGKTLQIRFQLKATGQEFIAAPADLIGDRDVHDKVPLVPRLQYAYGLTNRTAQGVTVDMHFDVAMRARGQEGTYVCATRHLKDFRMFVDLGRLAEDFQSRQPIRDDLPRRRSNPGRHLTPTPRPHLQTDDLKRAFYDECYRDDGQGNISDDIPSDRLREWANNELSQPAPPPELAKSKKSFRLVEAFQAKDLRLTVETLRDRILQRLMAPDGYSRVWLEPAREAASNLEGREERSNKILHTASSFADLVFPAHVEQAVSFEPMDAPST